MQLTAIKEHFYKLTLQAEDLAREQARLARELEKVHAELKATAGELSQWSLMVSGPARK
jgi:hypothetical protein